MKLKPEPVAEGGKPLEAEPLEVTLLEVELLEVELLEFELLEVEVEPPGKPFKVEAEKERVPASVVGVGKTPAPVPRGREVTKMLVLFRG